MRTQHKVTKPYKCQRCPIFFAEEADLKNHEHESHKQTTAEIEKGKQSVEKMEKSHAFNKFFKTYRIHSHIYIDVYNFVCDYKQEIQQFISNRLEELGPIKFQIAVFVKFVKPTDGTKVSCHASTTTKPIVSQLSEEVIMEMIDEMNNVINVFSTGGSGFVIEKIEHMDLNINKFKPIRGSSYIATPSDFINNRFLLNIKNNDQLCFAYCIIAALFPVDNNRNRVGNYTAKLNNLNWTGINFPVTLNQIPLFEKQNNISVNVFGFNKEKIVPLFMSTLRSNTTVPLLLLSDKNASHYCLITNFHAFMARQFGKKNHRYKFCERCLHGFQDSQSLERHAKLCGLHKAVNITMPEKDSSLKFTNWHKTMPVPIVIYADIEAITRKHHTCQPNPDNSFSLQKELQEPCAVGFVVKQQHSTDSYYSFEG